MLGSCLLLTVGVGCSSDTDDAAMADESSASKTSEQKADASKASSSSAPDAGTKGSSMPSGAAGSAEDRASANAGKTVERAEVYDAGSAPERNKVTPADLCRRIAEINCAGEAHCCDNPGRSVDECKQDLNKTCASDLMLDRVAMQPSTGFDEEAAERAYAELERRASMCDPTVAKWGAASDGLRGLLKGSVAEGASCKPTATVPDPVMLAAALLSCSKPETNACVYANPLEAWTCQPRAASGGGCVTDNNCSDGLYCVITAPGLPGTCKERKAVGESCDTPTQCASLFCKRAKCVEADQQAAYCLRND
jgi:hypothetical protein